MPGPGETIEFPRQVRCRFGGCLAFILMYRPSNGFCCVSFRLKRIVAIWFVMLIALPFTAPVHNCDLRDLLGIARGLDPSAVMPVTTDAACDANAFTLPLAASLLRVSTSLVPAARSAVGAPPVSPFDLPSSLCVQHAVLRL